jgi:hypothetical protein
MARRENGFGIASVGPLALSPKKMEIGFPVVEPHSIVYVVQDSGDRMPGHDRLTVC